ncbi:glycosyltransferase family 2 protein [Nitratireductor soli]|uniref:glycosyltransferase family 2 protein n=1 Tax=Nitratireductor soli TaxID=1670619 RepID=UPI000A98DE2A|nr:glycosyltransferase [Nitratireductor soli]
MASEAPLDAVSECNPKAMRFSVIVPVYQHWRLVPNLLACLDRQIFPQSKFETLLVDNGSTELTIPEDLPLQTRVLRCDTPGSYAARNHGARHAGGAWLVFTDADCLPSPAWLQALDDAAKRMSEDGALLAGSVEMVAASDRPGSYEIFDIVKGIPQARYVGRGYAATANLAVPRPIFDKLNGFDDKRFSGGDADFCRRAGDQGHPIVYVPEARVDHPARVTWQEVTTKARRIKGGQLTAGARSRQRSWMLATLTPPVRGAWRFLSATQHPLKYRLTAIRVLFLIWIVELSELVRLSFGGEPERR